MRTFDIKNENGDLIGFEVRNLFIGRNKVAKTIASIAGSEILVRPRLFDGAEVFCEFRLEGENFIIEEPFGDNSRYLITHKNGVKVEQLNIVKNVFKSLNPLFGLQAIFVTLLILAILINLFRFSSNFIAQDKCLDSGGMWSNKQCINRDGVH